MAQEIRTKKASRIIWAALPLLLSACGEANPDQEAPIAQEQRTQNGLSFNGLSFNGLSFNGISFNGISFNGLSFNGLSFNGISFNGLSFNGISFNGLTPGGLADPATKQVVAYLISCALPEGDSVHYDINGQGYDFQGQLGVAPEWKDGACGVSCQRWVSACLLARVNAAAEVRTVSLRGEHKGLAVEAQEVRDFPRREATYFGNIFLPQPVAYACLSPGESSLPRICGDNLEGCAMPVVGSCEQACVGTGRHKSFRDCHNPAATGAERFTEAVTVFLPK